MIDIESDPYTAVDNLIRLLNEADNNELQDLMDHFIGEASPQTITAIENSIGVVI